MQTACQAYALSLVRVIPSPKPKKTIPTRKSRFLILLNRHGEVLLEKRPPTGIWGGLWSLPECDHDVEIEQHCRENYGLEIGQVDALPEARHSFSHFHLQIQPLRIAVRKISDRVMETGEWVWYNIASDDQRGLAAPVMRLLQRAT